MAPFRPRAATKEDLLKIKSFLEENGLPEMGVDGCLENFVIAEDESGSWIGIAGVEFYGESGLLRSVAVDRHSRGRGHARTLVNTVLENARDKGIKTVYLLTENREKYFEQLGFEIVDRDDVDDAVKTSLEFTEACPESAVVMRKVIQ